MAPVLQRGRLRVASDEVKTRDRRVDNTSPCHRRILILSHHPWIRMKSPGEPSRTWALKGPSPGSDGGRIQPTQDESTASVGLFTRQLAHSQRPDGWHTRC